MATDKRKKLLKKLRLERYDAFEHVCEQLGITYTFPPEYYRRVTQRWLAKKAFCIKVELTPTVHAVFIPSGGSEDLLDLQHLRLQADVSTVSPPPMLIWVSFSGLQRSAEEESGAEAEDAAEDAAKFRAHKHGCSVGPVKRNLPIYTCTSAKFY